MLIDSHCHLNYKGLVDDQPAVLARARQAGIGGFLNISTRQREWADIIATAEANPDVWASVGIHPHEADDHADLGEGALLAATAHPKVIGIGDCCFKNRNTGELWPEGAWYKAGDFVRVPKYGGDRWMVKYEHTDLAQRVGNLIIPSKTITDHACFAIFKDRDVRAVVTGNPLELRAFI